MEYRHELRLKHLAFGDLLEVWLAYVFMFSLPSFFWTLILEFSIYYTTEGLHLLLFLCLYCVEGCLRTVQLHFLWPLMKSDCIFRHPSLGLRYKIAAKPAATSVITQVWKIHWAYCYSQRTLKFFRCKLFMFCTCCYSAILFIVGLHADVSLLQVYREL